MSSLQARAIQVWERTRSTLPAQATLAVAALGSGAALVATILTHSSLGLTLAIFAILAALLVCLWSLRVPAPVRTVAIRRARYGVAAGIAATIAYDVTRLVVVKLLGLRVHPFDLFVLFGQLIVGGEPRPLAWVVGTVYHYLNGILFAVAYMLILAGRDWRWGILWGLGLECLMLLLYPGWLNLRLLLVEFTVMSLAGHLAYGTTLGLIGQRRVDAWIGVRRESR